VLRHPAFPTFFLLIQTRYSRTSNF